MTGSGGWYQLLEIQQEAAAEAEVWRSMRPIACPLCGEPLQENPSDGLLTCRFDGWADNGSTHP